MSVIVYGCTTRTLIKRIEKKQYENYARMLWAILNKFWKQHPTKQQLYSHLPPISKTTQVRRTRHAVHCWRNKDKIISDVLLWTPTHELISVGWPARPYLHQLSADTGCNLEDFPEAMNDRDRWGERVMKICAVSATWWWWWWKPNECCLQSL